jgi:hypothetical protein
MAQKLEISTTLDDDANLACTWPLESDVFPGVKTKQKKIANRP